MKPRAEETIVSAARRRAAMERVPFIKIRRRKADPIFAAAYMYAARIFREAALRA